MAAKDELIRIDGVTVEFVSWDDEVGRDPQRAQYGWITPGGVILRHDGTASFEFVPHHRIDTLSMDHWKSGTAR